MLVEIYIEALLVDEELAEQVWGAWDAGETDDQVAWLAWWPIAGGRFTSAVSTGRCNTALILSAGVWIAPCGVNW